MTLPKNRTLDSIVCGVFLVLSVLVHFGRLGVSIDGIDLTTDPANYACMAAAMGHPEAFALDSAYNDPARYGVHATISTTLTSIMADGANYGLAYLKLSGVQFFLHYIAFYVLGIVLLKQRWQAVLFTVLMGQIYWLQWGTYWGNGHLDYTPRSAFAVFYAFAVVWALRILQSPRWWPFFMAAMGLLVYVHSISTLPIALGFWLGFAVCKPKEKSIVQHMLWLVFCGLCFVAVLIPFVLTFIRPGVSLNADDIALLREVLRIRYNIEFTEYWRGLKDFVVHYTLLPLFPVGIAGYVLMRRKGNEEERTRALQYAMWTLGVFCCAVLFWLDQEVSRALGRHPLEFDLIRVLRFWVFFAMCLGFMGINVWWRQGAADKLWGKKLAAFLWCGLFVGLFLGGQQERLRASVLWLWNIQDEARYEQAYAKNLQRAAMLQALEKYTHKGDLIYYPEEDQAIRYKALRSLVYSWKDSSIYYYAKDVKGLRFWYDTQARLKASPTAYIDLALESKAQYLLSARPQDKALLEKVGTLLWESPAYILLKIHR